MAKEECRCAPPAFVSLVECDTLGYRKFNDGRSSANNGAATSLYDDIKT